MKSKTLSSEKGLFLKNIKETWPIWATYTFILLWIVPIVLYFSISFANYSVIKNSAEISGELLSDIINIGSEGTTILIIIVSIVLSSKINSYLSRENSSCFYHALPFTRTRLFMVNYISGLVILLVPVFVTYVIGGFVTISLGSSYFGLLMIDFLFKILVAFVCYSLSSLLNVITGNRIMALIVYVIYFFISDFFISIMNLYLSNGLFGINNNIINAPSRFLLFLDPIALFDNLEYHMVYDAAYQATGDYMIYNVSFTVIYEIILGGIFLAAALLLYKRRKSETAGDVISFGFAKVVFKYGFAICYSMLMTLMLEVIILESESKPISEHKALQIVLFIISAIVGYLIAQMIIDKKFNIFKKASVKLPIIGIIAAVFISFLTFDIMGFESKVPDKSDIDSISINYKNICYVIPNDYTDITDEVIDTHNRLLAERYKPENYDYNIFTINYVTKEFESISRTYYVAMDDKRIEDMFNRFAREHIDITYNDSGIERFKVENITNAYVYTENNNQLDSLNLEDINAQRLFKALMKDIEENNITYSEAFNYSDLYMDYSVFDNVAYDEPIEIVDDTEIPLNNDSFVVCFEFRCHDDEPGSEYSYLVSKCYHFNKRCKNTMNYLNIFSMIPILEMQ